MAKYRLKAGVGPHFEKDGVKYTAGQEVETDRDLATAFPGKFELVESKAKAAKQSKAEEVDPASVPAPRTSATPEAPLQPADVRVSADEPLPTGNVGGPMHGGGEEAEGDDLIAVKLNESKAEPLAAKGTKDSAYGADEDEDEEEGADESAKAPKKSKKSKAARAKKSRREK